MKNLYFHIHTTNIRAQSFFRMLGAKMETNYIRPSWADSTDHGVEFDMVRVTLTPALQAYLHCYSNVDITGFLYYFKLVKNPRSRRDAMRAIARNRKAWDALGTDLLPLLTVAELVRC
jgi:hypothetical protein